MELFSSSDDQNWNLSQQTVNWLSTQTGAEEGAIRLLIGLLIGMRWISRLNFVERRQLILQFFLQFTQFRCFIILPLLKKVENLKTATFFSPDWPFCFSTMVRYFFNKRVRDSHTRYRYSWIHFPIFWHYRIQHFASAHRGVDCLHDFKHFARQQIVRHVQLFVHERLSSGRILQQPVQSILFRMDSSLLCDDLASDRSVVWLLRRSEKTSFAEKVWSG